MALIVLPVGDEDLFAQCDFEAYRASGKGGQHVNKTDSAVRLTHRPSGLVVTSQESRSQWRNRAICLGKLRERVAALNVIVVPRKPTRKPRSAKRQTRAAKRMHGEKKQGRSNRDWRDE